jgi:hypothetical protein
LSRASNSEDHSWVCQYYTLVSSPSTIMSIA